MNTEITENAFVLASKQQLRFNTREGQVSVEDLWVYSLEDLDKMALAIDGLAKASTKSFLDNPDTKDTAVSKANDLRLECLKIVIFIKQKENAEKLDSAKKRKNLEFLKGLRLQREQEDMKGLSLEDIDKQIAAASE